MVRPALQEPVLLISNRGNCNHIFGLLTRYEPLALMGIRATCPYQDNGFESLGTYQVSDCRFLPVCHQLHMLNAIFETPYPC